MKQLRVGGERSIVHASNHELVTRPCLARGRTRSTHANPRQKDLHAESVPY
jgi:hypothetical protein